MRCLLVALDSCPEFISSLPHREWICVSLTLALNSSDAYLKFCPGIV